MSVFRKIVVMVCLLIEISCDDQKDTGTFTVDVNWGDDGVRHNENGWLYVKVLKEIDDMTPPDIVDERSEEYKPPAPSERESTPYTVSLPSIPYGDNYILSIELKKDYGIVNSEKMD